MMPQVVWDPAKAAANWVKHGVSFDEAATVFRDPLLLVIPDVAHSQEEERWIALGRSIHQLLLTVIHTDNDFTIRLISARMAEPKERRQYERQTAS
jgi:uncharacterized protein